MIDDRMVTVSSKLEGDVTWTGPVNRTAWEWYLKAEGGQGGEKVSRYAAPARAGPRDLKGLPRTWIDVGSCDLFRDECVSFAGVLWKAGCDAELHVWPGKSSI